MEGSAELEGAGAGPDEYAVELFRMYRPTKKPTDKKRSRKAGSSSGLKRPRSASAQKEPRSAPAAAPASRPPPQVAAAAEAAATNAAEPVSALAPAPVLRAEPPLMRGLMSRDAGSNVIIKGRWCLTAADIGDKSKTSPFEYKHTAASIALPLPIDGNYTGSFNLKLAHG